MTSVYVIKLAFNTQKTSIRALENRLFSIKNLWYGLG